MQKEEEGHAAATSSLGLGGAEAAAEVVLCRQLEDLAVDEDTEAAEPEVQGDYPHTLVNFLRREGLGALQSRYGITAAHHSRYPNLVLLKYSQECRGTVLDIDADWKVVAYPYRKFFNYGEPGHARIDWSTAKVYDKLDGSLMTLYHYRGQWHVASSGRPDAGGSVGNTNITYRELFWEIWNKLGYSNPKDTNMCYMFELVSERNRIITKVSGDRIVLHGARDLTTGKELDPVRIAKHNRWECVRIFPMTELDQVINAAKLLNPALAEGFVACDAQFRRVKIKSPAYVAIAGLTLRDKNKTNKRRILQVVMTNEGSEYLSYFPEWAGLHRHIRAKYTEFIVRIQKAHEQAMTEISGGGKKRSYHSIIEKHIYKEYLLVLYEGKDLREHLAERPAKEVEELMMLEGLLESGRYLPSSSSTESESFHSLAPVAIEVETVEEEELPQRRGPKGRRKVSKQESEEDQTLQALAFGRRLKQPKQKPGKNAKKKNERRRR